MRNLYVFNKRRKNNFSGNILQKKSGISKTFLNLVAVMAINSIDAQTIKWNFDGGAAGTNAPSTTISNMTVSDLLQRNNNGTTTLITSASPSTGYAGSSGNFNAGAAAISAPFDKSTSTYFEFTFTPDQGYAITITAINFGSRSTSTGPQSYAVRSSIDSYNSDIASNLLPADSKWNFSQNSITSLSASSTITFRIYGFNGVNANQNTAVWRIDDLAIDLTVNQIKTSYRSGRNGNWSSPSTWEYSTDNVNWNTSTNFPSKNEENILIQSPHTVIINSPVSLDQAIIAGTLELQTGGVLEINDGVGDDITILSGGVLQINCSDNYSTSIKQSTYASVNISTNGKIEIGDGTSFTGNGYEGFATSMSNVWNDGAVFEYNNDKAFVAPGLVYFPNAPSNAIPVFRVSAVSGTPGVGSTKDFHVYGILEVNTDLTFSGTGDKYFRSGIRGIATLTVTGTGQIFLDGENAILGGTPLNIILNVNHPLKLINKCNIPTGANIIISNSNIDNNIAGNVFIINGTLDVTDQGIKNTNGKIIINGTYKTKNPGGFSGSGSSIVSGNIVVNSGSNIELNANGDQSLNARNDFFNLIFSGSGIKKPTGPFSPKGTLTIKDNAIFDCTGNINGINIGDDNTNLTMTGNSRLIVSTFGANPKMGGIYNLSGGVIEFKGLNGTAQNIRSKNYQNIEVSGNNVLMSDGNILLNTNGTFTVKTGGIFSINDNTIRGIGDATQTVIVESGGIFKCGTNMGFNGAAITSIPIKSSSINEDIKKVILQPGSTVDYTRNGDQPITNANGLVYQNLIISGAGNKIAPADDLIMNGDFSKISSAAFVHNNGTVIFNNNRTQSYSSVSPQIIFNNLTNKNTSGLNIKDSLSIYKQLRLDNNSVINLNADISLLSSKIQTATIGQLGTNVKINYGLGRFIIERYINTNTINGGHAKSWQFISVPAFGETIFDTWQEKGSKTITGYGTWITDKSGTDNGFDATSAAPSMKYFDEISNSYIGISGTYVGLERKNGYMIFIRGDRNANSISSPATPTVLRTRGKIYTRDFLPPVNTVSPGKFQSVGNPFASVIDFSKINSSNIGNYYIAWDPTLGGEYGVGGYQTITAATNFKPVPGNTVIYNSTSDYRNVQSGQAFFVFNHTAMPGSVGFAEECKMDDNQHLVNRETDTKRAILFASLISGERVADGNAIVFDKKFSNKIDGEDALKMNNASENFAIKTSEEILAVEARSELKESDTIFYQLNNLTKQEYKFAFVPENFLPGFEGYLVDRYLETKTGISLSDTTFVNFSVTSENASVMANRFYIFFKVAAPLPVFFLSMDAQNKNGNIWINWKVENENEIRFYDLEYSNDGVHFSKIGSVNSKSGFSNSYTFIHDDAQKGNNFYRIKIIKSNGHEEYKKIVKVFIPDQSSSIKVYANPVVGNTIQLQFVNQPKGKYHLILFNSHGQKIATRQINYSGGNSFQTINPNGDFIRGVYNLEILEPNEELKMLKVLR